MPPVVSNNGVHFIYMYKYKPNERVETDLGPKYTAYANNLEPSNIPTLHYW